MNTLDLTQAAALAKCHPNTLRQKMKDGEVPGTKIGRAWVVTESTFMAWLESALPSAAAPAAMRHWRHRWLAAKSTPDWVGKSFPRPTIVSLPVKIVRSGRPASYHVAKRRSAKMRRTPEWADMEAIAAIYRECRRLNKASRVRHEVDHEIPLQGRTVSGLHVHENLRIITRKENLKKHNKYSEAA